MATCRKRSRGPRGRIWSRAAKAQRWGARKGYPRPPEEDRCHSRDLHYKQRGLGARRGKVVVFDRLSNPIDTGLNGKHPLLIGWVTGIDNKLNSVATDVACMTSVSFTTSTLLISIDEHLNNLSLSHNNLVLCKLQVGSVRWTRLNTDLHVINFNVSHFCQDCNQPGSQR